MSGHSRVAMFAALVIAVMAGCRDPHPPLTTHQLAEIRDECARQGMGVLPLRHYYSGAITDAQCDPTVRPNAEEGDLWR